MTEPDTLADTAFDQAMVTAAMAIAAQSGWHAVGPLAAARHAGLDLARARARFPRRGALLLALGRQADTAALAHALEDGSTRDRLFDVLMRRIDALQTHRPGVLALLRALPADPATALLLACATRRSMAWMAEAAGLTISGPLGALRVKGLVAIWLWTVRAWERDDSEDLSATMAALDQALERAGWFARLLAGTAATPDLPELPEEKPTETDEA